MTAEHREALERELSDTYEAMTYAAGNRPRRYAELKEHARTLRVLLGESALGVRRV